MADHPIDFSVHDPEAELDLSRLAPGVDPDEIDPNHHLWRNGRLWWIAFTVHRGYLQERVRFSLGTDDVEQARRRRDRVFALFEQAQDCSISLRFTRKAVLDASAKRWRCRHGSPIGQQLRDPDQTPRSRTGGRR